MAKVVVIGKDGVFRQMLAALLGNGAHEVHVTAPTIDGAGLKALRPQVIVMGANSATDPQDVRDPAWCEVRAFAAHHQVPVLWIAPSHARKSRNQWAFPLHATTPERLVTTLESVVSAPPPSGSKAGSIEEAVHSRARPHLKALTGLRLFAALLVVFHHFWPVLRPSLRGWPSGLTLAMTRLAENGFIGVSLFFVLSGFILTYLYDHEDKAIDRKRFWVARFARIYPMYLLALVVAYPDLLHDSSQLLEKFPGLHGLAWSGFKAGLVLTLTQSWMPSAAQFWNGPAWSLSAEAFFYLLFPFMLALPGLKRLSRAQSGLWIGGLWSLTIAMGVGMLEIHRLYPRVDLYAFMGQAPIYRLPEFVIGILLARLVMSGLRDGVRIPRAWISLASIVSVFGFLVLNAVVGVPDELAISLNLPFAVLLVASLSFGVGPLAGLLSMPLMVLLGEASYGLYLLHVPIGHRFLEFQGLQPPRFAPLAFVLFLAFTLLLSCFLFKAYETPMRERLRERLMASRARASSAPR